MTRIDLSTISTRAPEDLDRDEAERQTRERSSRISELHRQLVAEKEHAVLVVLQGMDASGKDGALRNVFGDCAPYGLRAVNFRKPTEEEFDHDFLWRVHKEVPAQGEMVIFNRSHYEDVLIQRVHGWITEEQVDRRIASINAFEKLLQYDNNTLILKFYLHLSEEQQREELMERVVEPEKHYKHSDADWREREHWDEYRAAYEDVIARSEVPWHIIPVDQRWYRNYLMTDIVLQALEGLEMKWPELVTNRTWKV
ncbi:PPK2 family polyphosphate:nucleotide phosphotransferase [Lewinella marina]|uniref:Polyphosphate kinase n=1 Tax=Neolewinella marina TaxID=438751 RepID=A0A2G0CFF5_9BACT|nr:PPK2 family polyphosphate kinase [Neolewinella marina]NJB85607.1 PPK2 family polyphosphate:nucleotide phosphotransferase [Neolewinella marina]PHK98708.1 polyphosphate kinase [Neolewinella marina]